MKLKLALAASTALALVAAAPGAQAGDLYLSVFGGANFLADASGPIETTDGVWNSDADTGFVLGGAIGTRLDKWAQGLRVEMEVSYRRNDVGGLWHEFTETDPDNGTLGGNVSTFAVMANAWYDFDIGAKVTPYVGGGIGWNRMKGDLVQQLSETTTATDEASGFAYQLGAGFHYTVAPSVDVGLGYRYFHGANFGIDTSEMDGTLDNDNHVVQIDLTIGIN